MSNLVKISILLFVFLFLTTCAINQFRNIASDPVFHPKWDLNADIPVYDKTVSIASAFNNINIAPYPPNPTATPIYSGTDWPTLIAPTTIKLADTANFIPAITIPMITTINFDSGYDALSDLTVEGLYSRDSVLTIAIWLNNGTNNLPIDPNQIVIQPIKIETINYNFVYSYTDSNNRLIFKSTNFLDPSQDYYLNLGADGSASNIDIEYLAVNLNAGGTYTYSGGPVLNLYYQINFDLGSTYGVVGQLACQPANHVLPSLIDYATLFMSNNIDLGSTIKSLSISQIKNLQFKFIYDSSLPDDVWVNFTFTSIPSLPQMVVSSGTLGTANMGTTTVSQYNFSLGSRNTTSTLNIGDVSNFDNFKMNIGVFLPSITPAVAPTGLIRISPNDTIRVRLNVSGQATVGSN